LAAAAYAALGRPRRYVTGRHRAAIEAASQLRFCDVEPGSVVTVFALPTLVEEAEDTLGLGVDDLAGAAFDRLVAAFHQPDEQVDTGIARALAELADGLGIGERYDDLLLQSPRSPHEVRIDPSVRARMRRLADAPPTTQPDVLVGSLREADFDRRTSRLRTSSGETVVVAFPPELDDQVQEALRSQAYFEGIVTFDPTTATARRVELRRISNPEALPFDSEEFWTPLSVETLAEVQGIEPASFDRPLFAASEAERRELVEALAHLDA
jgi:hypothetical protein